MKTIYCRMLAAVLSLVLLCGCAADNTAGQENTSDNTPNTENTTPDSDTQQDDAQNSGDTEQEPEENSVALEAQEIAEWENYFNQTENNGLLRFPYADLETNPDQLAPYLAWLFYDIGDMESEFSEEELALLAETDLWLELDTHRLTRDFINTYLSEKLNISPNKTENLIDAGKLGVYLMEYDAWYMSHGDTELRFYEFDRGARFEDGTVKLHYFNDFLRVMPENGEMDYIDAEMIVTLAQREDGTWYVVSHEIDKSTWNEQ